MCVYVQDPVLPHARIPLFNRSSAASRWFRRSRRRWRSSSTQIEHVTEDDFVTLRLGAAKYKVALVFLQRCFDLFDVRRIVVKGSLCSVWEGYRKNRWIRWQTTDKYYAKLRNQSRNIYYTKCFPCIHTHNSLTKHFHVLMFMCAFPVIVK